MLFLADAPDHGAIRHAGMYATRLVRSERTLTSRELDAFVRRTRHEETERCATGRCPDCDDVVAISGFIGRDGAVNLYPLHPVAVNAQ